MNNHFHFLKGDIDELLWGKEYRYKQWIQDMRSSMAKYEAKPERTEGGLRVCCGGKKIGPDFILFDDRTIRYEEIQYDTKALLE